MSFYTCRHTFENELIEEIKRTTDSADDSYLVISPCEGLVVAGCDGEQGMNIDPVYALQTLPNCKLVEHTDSVKSMSTAIASCEDFQNSLSTAPRSSLSIHTLVPGMLKGQRDPALKRRVGLVAQQVLDSWKKMYPAARRQAGEFQTKRWLLQILLLSPNMAAVSLAPCDQVYSSSGMMSPNPYLPAGLAHVDIKEKMPSSAYRKLLEAFACMRACPSKDDIVVDLGASPGGWTKALRLLSDCRVVAIDRSELDPALMQDRAVKFVQGDAFTYRPPRQVPWMVSDIIAYPERILELLEKWCGQQLAASMVVTVKFQGAKPAWEELDASVDLASGYGYHARVKHFFNNKNEVTLMLRHERLQDDAETDLPSPLYADCLL